MTSPTAETFTCELCGGTFPKVWTDEDMAAEASEAFPDLKPEDRAVVCDDCWRKLRARFPDLDARYAK